jgi:hypothetical protein
MKNKLEILLVLLVGMLVGQFFIRPARALYEGSGEWSASEKRQVIDYLKTIARNTSRR